MARVLLVRGRFAPVLAGRTLCGLCAHRELDRCALFGLPCEGKQRLRVCVEAEHDAGTRIARRERSGGTDDT